VWFIVGCYVSPSSRVRQGGEMGVLLQGSLVVKRTFLEFVTSPPAKPSRARHFTDTQLLDSVRWGADVEYIPSVRPAAGEATPSLVPMWPQTPMLDALCEPDLGLVDLGATAQVDDVVGQEWSLPAAAWPGTLEDQQLVYQQPCMWVPLTDFAESWVMQAGCWSDPTAWTSPPIPSSASTDVCSEVDSGSETGGSEVWVGETRTTVMLRNVPSSLMRNMLLQLLDGMGFAGSCDMVYVPVDFSTGAGLGYALVNLVSPAKVPALWQAFDGFSAWDVASDKVCSISWSEPIQGLAQHIERYRNSPVMHPAMPDEWKPALFRQGVRVEFPAPTKSIKAPKVKVRAKKA